MKYSNEQLIRQRGYSKTWYAKNKDKVDKTTREYQKKVRLEVITRYGGKCDCCGESELAFLSLDHIGGGGMKQRRELGFSTSSRLYMWIRKNNYPSNFRVLCHNCNQATSWNRICPHKLLT